MLTDRIHLVHRRGLAQTGKFGAALAVTALVGAFGAGAGTAAKDPSRSCPVTSATSQPFLRWNDAHRYFLAPAGDMESGLSAAGWSLSGAAGLTAGNESYDVTSDPGDAGSLGLPTGSSATTPFICVTIHDPELRFFALNTGKRDAVLDVNALFLGNDGKLHTKDLGYLRAGGVWTVAQQLKFKDAIQPGPDGTGQVAFRFSPKDNTGNWRIDDLYVDPLKSQ
jgi:hypothetical protein